jgi:hypothetical protein
MRNIIQNLNKRTLADATGISYPRLRKFSSGEVNELREEEKILIYQYLVDLANIIKN